VRKEGGGRVKEYTWSVAGLARNGEAVSEGQVGSQLLQAHLLRGGTTASRLAKCRLTKSKA